MPLAYFLVALLPAITTGLSGNIALYAWHRREVSGSRAFALCSACIAIWCFFTVFEQLSQTERQHLIFGRAQYLVIPTFPVFWFLFTLQYTQYDDWLNRRVIGALSVIPLVSTLLAFSNHWHGWMLRAVEFQSQPFPKLTNYHGWWFSYIMAPYSYGLLTVGFCALISAFFAGSRLRQQQTLVLISAVLITCFLNVIYLLSGVTLYGLDPTPIGFAITVFIIRLSLFHVKFLDVTPISYKTAFLNTVDATILLNKRQRIVDLNPSALSELQQNINERDVLGQPFAQVFPQYRRLFEKIENGADEVTEVLRFPGAAARPSAESRDGMAADVYRQVKVRSLIHANGRKGGWAVIIRDITLEKQQQLQLEQLAYIDTLTGIANRRQLERRAEEILNSHPISIALLYIDLNSFKPINDNYGHAVGDAVLKHVARCLQKSVRKGDMVVRLGGDEFVAMLYEADVSVAIEVRSRLMKLLEQGVTLAGNQFVLSASVGTAYYPADGATLANLLRQADRNMYREKRLR